MARELLNVIIQYHSDEHQGNGERFIFRYKDTDTGEIVKKVVSFDGMGGDRLNSYNAFKQFIENEMNR